MTTTSTVAQFRRALVDHVATELGLVGIPHPPATPRAGQVFFKPADPYVSWQDPGTFAKPVLRFTLVLVAASNDIPRTWDWIDESVAGVRDALHQVERIGPFPRPAVLAAGPPGPLEGTDFYAVELTFAPVPIGDLS